MPPMKLFGRKWKIGSDDFVFPMIVEILIRLAWFIAMLILLLVYQHDLNVCKQGFLLKVYYVGMLLILGMNGFFIVVIMTNSMKGNILDENKKRRLVPCMMSGKIVFFIPEVIWICLGTALLFTDDLTECPKDIILALQIIIGFCWFFLVLLIVCFLIVFDPLGGTSMQRFTESSRIWKSRCKVICCWVNQSDEESFDEISRIMAEYFYGTDLVLTDIAAGLVLLNGNQKSGPKNRELLTLYDMTHPQKELSLSDKPTEWMNLRNAKHFMKYALGCYGWMFFVYDNTCAGPGRLCCSSNLLSSDLEKKVQGDSCCFCNTNAILQQTKITAEDILYANFKNKLCEIPFYIAVDHKYKAIVVAVRGTLSFYDVITDLKIGSQDMEIDSVSEAKAHKGILQAAMFIKNTIFEKNLLTEAFRQFPNYRLVVAGHSLGAGAASILSVLLKSSYENLICFSFSPPGWLVSVSLSKYMEDFVCSVIVGKDLVPRMGIYTLNDLKNNVMNAIKQSKKPKYRILSKMFLRACCKIGIRRNDESHLLHESSSTEISINAPDPPGSILDNPYPLFLPGKILYLEKASIIKGCCSKKRIYTAFWAQRGFFSEILVSSKMLSEHKPDVVYRALQSITFRNQQI